MSHVIGNRGCAFPLCRLGLPVITSYIEPSTDRTSRSILITFGLPRPASFAGLTTGQLFKTIRLADGEAMPEPPYVA